jgi:hypothetical protein
MADVLCTVGLVIALASGISLFASFALIVLLHTIEEWSDYLRRRRLRCEDFKRRRFTWQG